MAAKYVRSVAALASAIIVTAALALGPLSLIQAKHAGCEQVNVLRRAIVTILQSSIAGLPHNPYFKAHPDQLAAAEAQYQIDIVRLQPTAC